MKSSVLIAFISSCWLTCDSAQAADFAAVLKRSELNQKICVIDEDTALLMKDLELKRNEYARQLELSLEGLNAGRNVDEAMIEYEKAQIHVAAQKKRVPQAWQSINRQRTLVRWFKDTLKRDSQGLAGRDSPPM